MFIIIFIIILGFLVFVHEMGHFFMSRRFGAKAEEFGLGFPPRLAGFYKTAEGKWKTVMGKKEVTDAADTVYSINWIPLGGFVKIKGEDGEGKDDPESFATKPIWQRAWILSAGVLMNVVIAAVLLSVALMIGTPESVSNLNSKANQSATVISDPSITIIGVDKKSPAAQAGLKAGDEIVSIEGKTFQDTKGIQEFVGDKAGQALTYKIKRDNDTFEKEITPAAVKGSDRAIIGIALDTLAYIRFPWYVAILKGITTTGSLVWQTIIGFGLLIGRLFMGYGVSADVAGPVGIAVMTGQYANIGFSYLLQFAAMLSVSLAVINFVPFPALDGGRILFLIIEKIKGRPVKPSIEAAIHNIGFLFLIVLIILVTYKDIKGLFV